MVFGCMGGNTGTSVDEPDFDRDRFQKAIKLLLLGTGESGKTTIIKQMKIIHINGFTEKERRERIPFIKQNIHESIHDIVYNMDKIEPPVELMGGEENSKWREFILENGPKEPDDYTPEYFDAVKSLWSDQGVQETFKRSNEYQLIDCAQYFLERVDEIKAPGYMPSTQDILHCRIKTVGISEIEFEAPISKMQGGGMAQFLMYDVGGQKGERKKWIQVFAGIQAVLFIIAASDFDQRLREDEKQNRLQDAFDVFDFVVKNRYLLDSGLIVFLNKQDILKRKLENGRKFDNYFPKFSGYLNNKQMSDVDRANSFLKDRLVEISKQEVTFKNYDVLRTSVVTVKLPPREVFVHYTVATDTGNVKKVFESVQEIIVNSFLKKVANTGLF